MKSCILSDIHGNLEAFTAVLADLDNRKEPLPDTIISLGDVIGYGPDPEAAMALIISRGITSVLGNHEMAVVHPRYMRWFNPVSRIAVEHSLNHLSPESMDLIRTFPINLVVERMLFVHGVPPQSPFIYLFQITDTAVMKRLDSLDQDVVFVGHTHELALVEYTGRCVNRMDLDQGRTLLKPGSRYIVNAGSVGQPRDGNPSAKYLVYDTRTRELDIRFVPYDHTATAAKILDQGLPAQFAEKLSYRFDR
ncbi:MAG: metallophosphoesterase family protein [Pseudomonadota bacterium]